MLSFRRIAVFWLVLSLCLPIVHAPGRALAGKCEGTVITASWLMGSEPYTIQVPYDGDPDNPDEPYCYYHTWDPVRVSLTLMPPADDCYPGEWGTCGCPADTPYRWFFDYNWTGIGHYFGPCDTYPSTIGPNGTYLLGGYDDINGATIQISGGATPAYGVPPSSTVKSSDIGDPINARTRSFYFYLPLFNLGGPLPVAFNLAYQSYSAAGDKGFVSSVPRIKRKSADEIYVTGWEGGLDTISFNLDTTAGQWQNHPANPYQYALQEEEGANGWFTLMDPSDQTVYLFEKNSLEDTDTDQAARLRFRLDRSGNQVAYTYSCWDCASGTTTISDGLGRKVTLTVSGTGGTAQAQVSDGSRSYSFAYNTAGQLTEITDPSGAATGFAYSGNAGSLVKQTRPMGNSPYVQTYDADDETRTAAQTDALGNTTTLTLLPDATAAGDRVLETRPDGTQWGYDHSSSGSSPLAIIDNTGSAVTFSVDDNDRITGATDRLGDTIAISYHDQTGFPASFTNAEGHTVSHTYTAQDQVFDNPAGGPSAGFTFYNLTRTDYPDGSYEAFGYDGQGNLTSHTDRNGNVTAFTRNSRGQVLTVTNPAGGVRTYTYNQDATMASSADSDTGITTYAYDGLGRLITIDGPGPGQTDLSRDVTDRITGITDENGHSFQYAYDANGNLIQVTDPLGNDTHYAYDAMDRIQQVTDRSGSVSSLAYNFRGQTILSTDANNDQTEFSYDDWGWFSGAQANGAGYTVSRDAEGAATGVETPQGLSYEEETDKLGLLTAVTFPGGGKVQVVRDAMTRIKSGTDPLGYETLFEYDKEGLVTKVEKADGSFVGFDRNALGGIAGITDFNGQEWQFGHTPMGRLTSVTDPLARTTSYSLDNRGRVSQAAFPGGDTETRSYDPAGNLVQRAYSDGTTLSYAYDALDNLVSANNLTLTRDSGERITGTGFGGQTFTVSYDPGGRISEAGYGGVKVSYAYNSDGLLAAVSDTTGVQVNFTYDADGGLTGMDRSNAVNAVYTWDGNGRLSRIREGGFMDLTYTYDPAGRVTAIDGTWPLEMGPLMQSATPQTVSVDPACQASGTGFSYDGRGRALSIPGHSLAWNAAGMLTGLDNTTLAYNGLGDIISRTENGTTTLFFHNHGLGLAPLVAEQQNGTFLRYYIYTPEGHLLYSLNPAAGNAVTFYHFDHTGSTLALTDGSGTVTDRYAYTPYGELLSHTGASDQPFTYGGRLGVRKEGDLYHMRRRYYDPGTARFLSPEPFWPAPEYPDGLNPYQYAFQSPLVYADPTGGWALLLSAWGQLFADALDPQNHTEGVAHGNWADNVWNTASYREMYRMISDTARWNVEQEGKKLLERQKEAYHRKRMRGLRNLVSKKTVKSAFRAAGEAAGVGETRKDNTWQKAAETRKAKGSLLDRLNQRRKKYNRTFNGDYTAFDSEPPERTSADPVSGQDDRTGIPAEKKKSITRIFQTHFNRMGDSGGPDTP